MKFDISKSVSVLNFNINILDVTTKSFFPLLFGNKDEKSVGFEK
jgi:hypothetical protein